MGSIASDLLPLERVYRWERERPASVFLSQPAGGTQRDWTWAQALSEARRMACWLATQGWEPGSRVGILSKNCAWWMMADLAIWMAGHVTVPVYPSLRSETVQYILEHSGAKACFLGDTDEKEGSRDGLPSGVACIDFPTAPAGDAPSWEGIISRTPPITGNPVRAGGDLATIIYTSGTTGVPKGVMHSFENLAYNGWVLAQHIHLTAADRTLSYLPLAHIVERAGLEGTTFYVGDHVYFTEGVEKFLADLHRARPTIFLSVPRLLLKFQQGVFAKTSPERLERLLRIALVKRYVRRKVLHALGLDSVRFAACGAAPLPVDLLLWYRRLGLELGEGYGMTEILITHLCVPGKVRPGSVGVPLPGVEAKLGENDELLVKSPMNMLGYYKDPEGTRNSYTPDGYFRTGDVARIDDDGQLRIVGRLKEQFKTSKGKYVAPAPIESKLVAHPDVEACCLMGAGMPSPFAVVILSAEARQRCVDPAERLKLEASLRVRLEEVNAQLDPHERVAFVAVAYGPWTVGNGLITPTLKVRRAAVEGRYQAFIDDWNRQKAPVVWESAS